MDRKYTDKELKELWEKFGDIPMNPETEKIEAPFLHFETGTDKEDIWHWFDENYSAGVYYLLYPGKLNKIIEMIDKRVQEELRYETDNITNKGWEFIEGKAPRICIKLIMEDYGENELSEVDEGDISSYFSKALEKSEFKLREYD